MGGGVCGLWHLGRWGIKINIDYSTISITNAGAKRSYFLKTYKNVHLEEMDVFVYLENVSMIFTDSYKRGVHLGQMHNFVHLLEMYMAVKRYMSFVA